MSCFQKPFFLSLLMLFCIFSSKTVAQPAFVVGQPTATTEQRDVSFADGNWYFNATKPNREEPKQQTILQPPTQEVEKSVWPLTTRIPFTVAIIGGLVVGGVGLGLELSSLETNLGKAFLAGGLSLLFAAPSALMWWNPTTWKGIIGTVLGLTSVIGGILFTAQAIPGWEQEYGWGLLAAGTVHIAMNVVGWLNHSKKSFFRSKKKKKPLFVLAPVVSPSHVGFVFAKAF